MKKLVFYYLFVGLPALLMLVSTSRTIIEYGSFPFTGSLLSQKFYFKWCLLMCSVILRDIKDKNHLVPYVKLYHYILNIHVVKNAIIARMGIARGNNAK